MFPQQSFKNNSGKLGFIFIGNTKQIKGRMLTLNEEVNRIIFSILHLFIEILFHDVISINDAIKLFSELFIKP